MKWLNFRRHYRAWRLLWVSWREVRHRMPGESLHRKLTALNEVLAEVNRRQAVSNTDTSGS